MIDHLSSSQINLYLRCSLKYKFQYIDKIPKPFQSSGLAFGTVIHASLQWLHNKRMKGEDINLTTLYRIFEADWYALTLGTEIHYKDNENERGLLLMGREMLGLYFHSRGNGLKGAEVPFSIPFVNTDNGECLDIPLEGIFDLIEEDDVIVEFKTCAKTINPKDPNYYIQLTAYSYAYQMLYQKPAKSLKIIAFVKTKKPKVIPSMATRDKKDHQRFFYLAKEVIKGIRSHIFFPQPSFWCNDCEYEEPCWAWRGN